MARKAKISNESATSTDDEDNGTKLPNITRKRSSPPESCITKTLKEKNHTFYAVKILSKQQLIEAK